MVRRWKQEQKNLLIIDAGDLFYPGDRAAPSEDRKIVMNLKAKAIVAAFNHMGCDAITIGESDLLWGKEDLLEIVKGAQFPVISANLIDTKTGSPLFRPYVIKQMEGLRVGIFGLFPKPHGNTDGRFRGLAVLEPTEVAQRIVSTLREKADFVILLSHLGYPKDLELARNVKGINVIVGGHTGINLSHPRIIRNTVVLQVAKKGRYLGRVDLTIKDPSLPFVNVVTRETLRSRLQRVEKQLQALGRENPQDSAETTRKRKTLERRKAETERILQVYGDHNELANRVVPLAEGIPGDAECGQILGPYLQQISEVEKASPPKGGASPSSSAEQSE